MLNTTDLKEKIAAALTVARDVAKAAEDEGRDFTAEERQKVAAAIEEAKNLKTKLAEAESDDALRATIASLGETIGLAPERNGNGKTSSPPPPFGFRAPERGKTIGEQFLSDPLYQAWFKSIAPDGRVPDSLKGLQSPTVHLKAIITGVSDTSAGALVFSQALGLADTGAFQRPLTVRDVITVGQTGSDTVEYARVTGFTNAAAPTAEASATTGTSGTKPESTLTLERVTAVVKTIAHWLPATKRALSDAAQIRTLIDNFLRYGLEEELEDQMINGDGTGENFTGISNTTGVQAQAWDTDLLTTSRKARTKVRTVGRATPTAYLLNPADWERFDLLTNDTAGNFYFGGPMALGTPRLWGLPVVESEAVTAGTGYVGDLRTAVLWDREQASITVSDSHSDFFVRNMVAILGEMRAAFGVFRPSAIVELPLPP